MTDESDSRAPCPVEGSTDVTVYQPTAGATAESQQLTVSRQSSHCKQLKGVKLSPEVWGTILKSMIGNREDLDLIGTSHPDLWQMTNAGDYSLDYKYEGGKKRFIRLQIKVVDSSDDAAKRDLFAVCAEVELEKKLGLVDRMFRSFWKGGTKNETGRSSNTTMPVEADRALIAVIKGRMDEGGSSPPGPETTRKETDKSDKQEDHSNLEEMQEDQSSVEGKQEDHSNLEGMQEDQSSLEGKQEDHSNLEGMQEDQSSLEGKQEDHSNLEGMQEDQSSLEGKQEDRSSLKGMQDHSSLHKKIKRSDSNSIEEG